MSKSKLIIIDKLLNKKSQTKQTKTVKLEKLDKPKKSNNFIKDKLSSLDNTSKILAVMLISFIIYQVYLAISDPDSAQEQKPVFEKTQSQEVKQTKVKQPEPTTQTTQEDQTQITSSTQQDDEGKFYTCKYTGSTPLEVLYYQKNNGKVELISYDETGYKLLPNQEYSAFIKEYNTNKGKKALLEIETNILIDTNSIEDLICESID